MSRICADMLWNRFAAGPPEWKEVSKKEVAVKPQYSGFLTVSHVSTSQLDNLPQKYSLRILKSPKTTQYSPYDPPPTPPPQKVIGYILGVV